MANSLFDKARELFLTAGIDWSSDTIKCQLIDYGAWTPNYSTNNWLADVSISARIGSPQTLTGKTTSGGAADANDVTFSSISGPQLEALLLYKDTSVEATSPLIAIIDQAYGLPITPNGGDIIVTWDNGTNRIFRL